MKEKHQRNLIIALYIFVGVLAAAGFGSLALVPFWILADIIAPEKITYVDTLGSVMGVACYTLAAMGAMWTGSEIYKKRH